MPTGIGSTLASGIWTYAEWHRTLYVITDEEIYVKRGLISRDVTQVRLDRVQNTAYKQSVLERVLSFADVQVFTAGRASRTSLQERSGPGGGQADVDYSSERPARLGINRFVDSPIF